MAEKTVRVMAEEEKGLEALKKLNFGIKQDKHMGVVSMKMEERDRLIAVKGEMCGGLKN